MVVTESYDDYIDINGVKLPASEKMELPGMSFSSKNTYEVNIPMDDSIFERSK